MIQSLLLAALLAGETATVTLTPEPMAVTRAVYGNIPIGTWSVRLCSDSTEAVAVDAGKVYQAAQEIRPIGKARALTVLARGRSERKALRFARAIEWASIGATAFAASERASLDLVKYLALSIPVLKQTAQRLEQGYPAFDASEILDGKIVLEPYGCAERVAFAAIQKGVRPVSFGLPLPPAPLLRGVTSIPR